MNSSVEPPVATSSGKQLLVAGAAAFCTYFCMYAFRKPFSAGMFEGLVLSGAALKPILVLSQLAGYLTSKFIGIRVISELRRERRAITLVSFIIVAELALVGFATFDSFVAKAVCLFFNGLPLGMVFGIVLAYLEGRRQSEALASALCASFIMSSGVVKSVGRTLVENYGISEFAMPMYVGLIFFLPLLVSVYVLSQTPPPDEQDQQLRQERQPMTREDRRNFVRRFWPGLSLLIFVYVSLTVIRTIRDDFGVEIWRDMGVMKEPEVFATSETIVAVVVTLLNATLVFLSRNLAALRAAVAMMTLAFAGTAAIVFRQSSGSVSPFVFMVGCGIGLYVPYVAFHTTVFERVVAASRMRGNIGFLMYVADALGYLGYAIVMVVKTMREPGGAVLPFFCNSLIVVSFLSVAALMAALVYFQRAFASDFPTEFSPDNNS